MNRIVAILKDNITPLLFFGGVIFIILSISNQANINSTNAKSLISKINTNVLQFDTQLKSLISKSITLDNTKENYSQTKDELISITNLLEEIEPFGSNYPSENKLINSYNALREEIITNKSIFIERSDFFIDNFDLIQNSSKIEDKISNLDQNSYQSIIFDSQKLEQKVDALKQETTKSFVSTIYLKNYSFIKEILKINLEEQNKNLALAKIKELDKNGKNYQPSFAYLDSSIILTKKYTTQIAEITKSQDLIKEQYSL